MEISAPADAYVKNSIQREVFEKRDERILKCLPVVSLGKRKRCSYLCVTISYLYPVSPHLHEVMFNEKTRQFFIIHSWLLTEIKLVNGINPRKVVSDFEITVDDTYRWETSQPVEKDNFVRHIWKMCHRYRLSPKPEFVNISIPVEEMMNTVSIGEGDESASVEPTPSSAENADDFHTISASEQADFRALLSKYNSRIDDAKEFLNRLMKELVVLDEANMQTIVGSERQIAELLNHIDQLLTESNKIQEVLDAYDRILLHVKYGVEMMEEKDMLLLVCSNNRQKLKTELKNFLVRYEFLQNLSIATSLQAATKLSEQDKQVLSDCDLSSPKKIVECSRAAFNLQKCIEANVSPGMEKMSAYEECMRIFLQLRERFSERFVAHLTTIFRSTIQKTSTPGRLVGREVTYGLLRPFSDLMGWLKSAVPAGYHLLIKRYIECTRETYADDIGQFIIHLDSEIASKVHAQNIEAEGRYGRTLDQKSLRSSSTWTSIDESVASIPTLSPQAKKTLYQLINSAFSEIEQCIVQEEKFCSWFFHTIDSRLRAQPSTQFNEEAVQASSLGNQPNKSVIMQIFDCIDETFQRFLDDCEQRNSFLIVYMLSAVGDRASSQEDNASVAVAITGKLMVLLKRRFDALMEKHLRSLVIEPSVKKVKYEILWTLRKFFVFAGELESAYEDRQRRSELDRWYPQMVQCLWNGIELAANDPNSKSPPPVVRLENYHTLHSMLSQLKVNCLNDLRKETKVKYSEALEIYVESLIDGSMDKVKALFDGISHCMEQGMTPEEITYQQAFSRQEVKRIVGSYQLANVKKEISNLYGTVEAQLSKEKHLLQVVWRNVQDCFIRKFKRYESSIELCYSNSNIRFDFTVDDILSCFSAIAFQH